MKILAKIAAFWRQILAEMAEDSPPYPLVQGEWEHIQATAQATETLQQLGLVQHSQGWAMPDERA
jgi:hypothetical protein